MLLVSTNLEHGNREYSQAVMIFIFGIMKKYLIAAEKIDFEI